MKSQYTPGPWHIESNQFTIWDDTHAIAAVYGINAPEPMASEARQHALLISAAPALLAACRAVLEAPHATCSCADKVRDAISKAVGSIQMPKVSTNLHQPL